MRAVVDAVSLLFWNSLLTLVLLLRTPAMIRTGRGGEADFTSPEGMEAALVLASENRCVVDLVMVWVQAALILSPTSPRHMRRQQRWIERADGKWWSFEGRVGELGRGLQWSSCEKGEGGHVPLFRRHGVRPASLATAL